MLSRLVCGVGRCSQFMENCEACVLAETRCNTEERDKKFQVHCVDVRDVEVVCDMCCSSLGRRAGRMEAANRRQLSASRIDDAAVAETLGVEDRRHMWLRQRKEP